MCSSILYSLRNRRNDVHIGLVPLFIEAERALIQCELSRWAWCRPKGVYKRRQNPQWRTLKPRGDSFMTPLTGDLCSLHYIWSNSWQLPILRNLKWFFRLFRMPLQNIHRHIKKNMFWPSLTYNRLWENQFFPIMRERLPPSKARSSANAEFQTWVIIRWIFCNGIRNNLKTQLAFATESHDNVLSIKYSEHRSSL